MAKRRFENLTGNIDLYIFLVLLSLLFHIRLDEIAGEPAFIRTTGLSYLLIIYTGYKFGRLWGALAGGISAGFWFVWLLFSGSASVTSLLFGASFYGDLLANIDMLANESIVYGSLQYVLIFMAIGYLAGFIMDKVEIWLEERNLNLESILPRGKGLYLQRVGTWLEQVIRVIFLLQIAADNKKAVILGRLRRLFVIIVIVPLLFSFSFFGLEFNLGLTDLITINLVPLAPVIALWIAYSFGPGQGVLASLSLLLVPLSFAYLNEMTYEEIARIGISSPDGVSALAVSAWALGTIGKSLRDPAVKERIFTPADSGKSTPNPRLKVWHIILFLLLALEYRFYSETYSIYFNSFAILLIAAAWSGKRFDPRQVSNVIFLVLGLYTFFRFPIRFESSHPSIYVGGFMLHEVVLIALIPLLLGKISIDSLNKARVVIASFLGLAWLAKMVCAGWTYDVFPNLFLLLYWNHEAMALISILALAILAELGARWLLFITQKTIT